MAGQFRVEGEPLELPGPQSRDHLDSQLSSQVVRRAVESAEFELTWGSQSSANNSIEEMARILEKQGEAILEQGQEIAEQGQAIARQAIKIDASMRQAAGIAREVVATGDQIVGRLRQMDDKFAKFLGALEREAVSSQSFKAL